MTFSKEFLTESVAVIQSLDTDSVEAVARHRRGP